MSLIRFCSVLILISFSSCNKRKNENNLYVEELKNGYLVLNEGLFNLNNASLSWVNPSDGVVNSSIFENKTGRQLGDTGNDMIRYGNKLYIVVNVSSTVEILDATSLKSLAQLSMISGGIAKQPRNCLATNGKVYISCFDGYVDVIDTISLLIEKRIKVGSNPENLFLKDDLIYVANSGGLNGSKMDSTISVIDTKNQLEINKIVVGTNPGKIIEGINNELFVVVRGDYNLIPSRLKKIDLTTKEIVDVYDFNCIGIEKMKDEILLFDANSVHLFSMKENKISTFNFIDIKELKTVYKIQYISNNERIILLDANGYVNTGYLFEFDAFGHFRQKYHVGLNPNKVIFYE